MVRILLPRFVYADMRLTVLDRMCKLKLKTFVRVKRKDPELECDKDMFLEGFLANETLLSRASEKITDKPLFVRQEQFTDHQTWLIEDMDGNPH